MPVPTYSTCIIQTLCNLLHQLRNLGLMWHWIVWHWDCQRYKGYGAEIPFWREVDGINGFMNVSRNGTVLKETLYRWKNP